MNFTPEFIYREYSGSLALLVILHFYIQAIVQTGVFERHCTYATRPSSFCQRRSMNFACHERSLWTPLIDHATFFNRVKRSVVALNHPASTCQPSSRPCPVAFLVHLSTTRARGPTFPILFSTRCRPLFN